MNDLTYKERAKNWVESLDDITIDSLELIIMRFNQEIIKIKSTEKECSHKLIDLEGTLQYLNDVLQELIGDDGTVSKESPFKNDNSFNLTDHYEFDPSALVRYEVDQCSSISNVDKDEILKSLRMSPYILKSSDEIKRKFKV